MARAGMARWRAKNSSGPSEGGDEVQRSLELLDRVLSEFDDLENGNASSTAAAAAPTAAAPSKAAGGLPQPAEGLPGGGGGGAAAVPESPLGHQSEDDGYMSMNGRRPAKLALGAPLAPVGDAAAAAAAAASATGPAPQPPPPPEEAERIISTLLPRLSPGSCAALGRRPARPFLLSGCGGSQEALSGCRVTTATQTTLPKTRAAGHELGLPALRFASLPPDSALQRAARRLPPRTVPGACAAERHREVRRRRRDDEDNFSDDSLESEPVAPPADAAAGLPLPPPPPPTSPAPAAAPSPGEARRAKRPPVAWEVALHDQPGSTRVVGRRRRRSADHVASGQRGRGRVSVERRAASTDDDSASASASATPSSDAGTPEWPRPHGTYVIRKGRRREPLALPPPPPAEARASASSVAADSESSPPAGDLKRCSSTFDNIRSLLSEGRLEGLDEPPPDFAPPAPPALVRVVSLPSLPVEPPPLERSRSDGHRLSRLHELAVTLEEDDDDGVDDDVVGAAPSRKRSPSAGPALRQDELASPASSRDSFWQRDEIDGSSADGDAEPAAAAGAAGGCFFLRAREPAPGGQAVSDVENKRRLSQCEEAIRCIIEGDRRGEPLFSRHSEQESLDFSDLDDRRVTSQSEDFLSSCTSLDAPASSSREDIVGDSSLDEEALPRMEDLAATEVTYTKVLCGMRARHAAEADRIRVRDGEPAYQHFTVNGVQPLHDHDHDHEGGLPEASSADHDHDGDASSLNSMDVNGKLSQEDSLDVTPSPSNDEGVNCCSTQGSSADEAGAPGGGGDEMSEEEARLIRQLRREHLQLQHPVDLPRQRRDAEQHAHAHTVRVEVRQDDYRPAAEQVTVSAELEFPPLPPSPVEEAEDEYSEILPGSRLGATRKTDTPQEDSTTRQQQPPPPPPHQNHYQHHHPHQDAASSLRTRSMDAGFGRAARGHSGRREVTCERRTLPPELPPHRRPRAYAPRSPAAPPPGGLQTSCSLPETPIFARGVGADVPRTPLRRGGALPLPELPAGGPGRGWYPRHRARPASSEHLDRLGPARHHAPHAHAAPWDAAGGARKPTTLPPNLSPKFFHRSPREALRRVTSLLIRKGSSSKESKKEQLSPTGLGVGSESRHKRGFFRSLWKRSRHYSLEQQ